MGRPLAISPESAAIVEAQRVPGQTIAAWHRRCLAAGVKIARHTLEAYDVRARADATPADAPPGPPPPETLTAAVDAAAEGDDLAELRRLRRVLALASREWEPFAGTSAPAVRALDALIGLQTKIAKAIAELTPRPEAERYKPIEAAALAALLDRAAANATAEDYGRRRLAEFERLLETGKLVPAD